MSEYGEIKNTEETQSLDIEKGSETSPEKTYSRRQLYLSNLCTAFIIISVFWIFIYIYTCIILSTPSPKSTQNTTDSLSSNDLTAGLLYSHSSGYKTCDDLQYGCCKIYSHCQIKEGYLDYDESQLAIRLITPDNRIRSNCYSLDDLAHKWNVEYKDKEIDDCTNSTYGCCPSINTACDFALRNKRGNNQDTIDFYKQHMDHSYRITVPKKDKEGSNCPSFGGIPTSAIVYAYNNDYPKPDDDIITPIISTLCFIACMLLCLSECEK